MRGVSPTQADSARVSYCARTGRHLYAPVHAHSMRRSLPRNLSALFSRFRQSDRNCLFPAFHSSPFAAFPGTQCPAFLAVHRAFHCLARCFSISGHACSSSSTFRPAKFRTSSTYARQVPGRIQTYRCSTLHFHGTHAVSNCGERCRRILRLTIEPGAAWTATAVVLSSSFPACPARMSSSRR